MVIRIALIHSVPTTSTPEPKDRKGALAEATMPAPLPPARRPGR